jgi:hypothetical protein
MYDSTTKGAKTAKCIVVGYQMAPVSTAATTYLRALHGKAQSSLLWVYRNLIGITQQI